MLLVSLGKKTFMPYTFLCNMFRDCHNYEGRAWAPDWNHRRFGERTFILVFTLTLDILLFYFLIYLNQFSLARSSDILKRGEKTTSLLWKYTNKEKYKRMMSI